MISNKLKINDSKTEFLVISSPRAKISKDLQIAISDSLIKPSSTCKSLGVVFDKHFTMDAQISNICRSTHFHIRNISMIRDLLPFSAVVQLVHSLVSSRLDYCNALLLGVPDCKIQRLQKMLNIAARLVVRPPRDHDIVDILKSLHWLPVKARVLFKVLLLVYKSLNNLAPEYLSSLFIPYQQLHYGLRSNNLQLLRIPKSSLKSYGKRSFSYGAAVEWNKLPLDLRLSPSVSVFKSKLKTYLFRQCYG